MRRAVSRTRHVYPPTDREDGSAPTDGQRRAKRALKGSHHASLGGGLEHTNRAEAFEREVVSDAPLRTAETTLVPYSQPNSPSNSLARQSA